MQEKLWQWFENGQAAIDRYLAEIGQPEQKEACLRVYREHMPQITLNDGVLEQISQLKSEGIKLGIITDGRPNGQWNKIRALGLDKLVDDIIVTDELGGEQFRKPCDIAFRIMQRRWKIPFEQMMYVIEKGKEYGFKNYIPLQFYKNYSPQVLKANMRVVGNTEYAILLYRNRLPKFNNNGKMVFNAIPYPRDTETIKVHPTQKSVPLLRYLIELFTDPDDVVIDPCAGSGTTLLAAMQMGRRAYGFEIKKDFFKEAKDKVLKVAQPKLF